MTTPFSYILHHTNRDLSTAYKFSALVEWAGRVAAALGVAAERIWICAADAAQSGCAAVGVCIDDSGRDSGLLSAAAELCGAAVCDSAGADCAGRFWSESAAAVSGDGDPSADAVSGLCGILGAVCVCAGCADDAVSGGEVDPHYAALDDGDVAVSDLRNLSGRALGLQRAGLGRLLGMGPGGECQPDAVADGDGVSALGDDAGEARDDEDVERLADLLDVPADDPGDAADALGHCEFRCMRLRSLRSETGSTGSS